VKQKAWVWVLAGALLLSGGFLSYVWAQEQGKTSTEQEETYTYTVKKGDTLWDISEELYHDPWVWPKVWEWNQYITNPHWIYPGNRLRVYYELPGGVKPAPAVSMPQPTTVAPPEPLGPAHITFKEIDQVGFITPEPPQGIGLVLGERHQKVLISLGDEVFVQMRHPSEVKVGDRYMVIKTSEKILHPITNKEVGYLNTILGVLEVLEVTPSHALTRVVRSYFPIEEGDKLMPYREHSPEIVLQDATEPKEGYVILARDRVRLMADYQIVFLDLGEEQGIQTGNRFEVYREPRATSLLSREPEIILTAEPIAELLVLSVEKDTAAAVVTSAKSEFIAGERVRAVVQN